LRLLAVPDSDRSDVTSSVVRGHLPHTAAARLASMASRPTASFAPTRWPAGPFPAATGAGSFFQRSGVPRCHIFERPLQLAFSWVHAMSAVASDRLMASARVLATYSASSMPEITRFPFPGESTCISIPIGTEDAGLKPLLTHASARALDPRPRTAALGAGRSGLFGQGCSLCAGVGWLRGHNPQFETTNNGPGFCLGGRRTLKSNSPTPKHPGAPLSASAPPGGA
jgi:hypothetical protein